jgi:GNAT superfamily N-acetyltransferase
MDRNFTRANFFPYDLILFDYLLIIYLCFREKLINICQLIPKNIISMLSSTTIELLKNYPDLIPDVIDLWYNGTVKKAYPIKPTEGMTACLTGHLNNDTYPLCFIALNDNKVVGMVRFIKEWTTDPNVSPWIAENSGTIYPWICGLVVDESYQRQGIGKQLALKVIDKAKEMGCKHVYIGADMNDPYGKVYEKYGCINIAETTFRGAPTTIYQYCIDQQI